MCCTVCSSCAAAHILSAIDPATSKPIDDAHAKGEIATFMAAGFETTSHAITWCLTMLVSGVNQQNSCSGAMAANCKRLQFTV
jgi:cytochrome P450